MEIDEITQALTLAHEAVLKVELPEEWREPWGREVLRRLLAEGQPLPSPLGELVQATAVPSAADSRLGRLAVRVGVPESALADVFDVEGDDVALHVPSARIAAAKSRATREIALLIAAARQGAGIDESSWTDISHVRDALIQYNRYDQSNFAKYVRDTDDVFNLRGKPVQHLRLTRPGWEAAEAMIKSLAGLA
jgi:hypothetical protein